MTVAVRGDSWMSAISPKKSDASSLFTLRPFLITSAVPSTSTKNSRPGFPSRVSSFPSLRSISSAIPPIASSSRLEQLANSGVRFEQLRFRILSQTHARSVKRVRRVRGSW